MKAVSAGNEEKEEQSKILRTITWKKTAEKEFGDYLEGLE